MTTYDNDTLEAAAQLLESMAGNTVYQFAWRAGAKKIRSLKVLKSSGEILNDRQNQISNQSQPAR